MNVNLRQSAVGLFAALALTAAAFAPTVAQDAVEPQAQQEVSEDELQAFAQAAIAVEEVGNTWLPRIQAAEDEQEANQLSQQAQAEMVSAVESEGLTLDAYNRIYEMAQADPDLQARVIALIQAQ